MSSEIVDRLVQGVPPAEQATNLDSPHGQRALADFRAAATPHAHSSAVREFDTKHRDLVIRSPT